MWMEVLLIFLFSSYFLPIFSILSILSFRFPIFLSNHAAGHHVCLNDIGTVNRELLMTIFTLNIIY